MVDFERKFTRQPLLGYNVKVTILNYLFIYLFFNASIQ